MTELNTGEVVIPAGGSPANEQPNSTADMTALKNEELEDELKRLREEKENYRLAFLKNKQELAERDFSTPPTYRTEVPKPSNDDIQAIVQAEVNQRLAEQAEAQRQENVKTALSRFFDKYPQYRPDNDINDENYNRLKSVSDRMVLGNTEQEILKSLEFVHRGLQNPIIESEVEDSGVGRATQTPKGQLIKPNALTRPLNEWEKKASEHFPGGEKAYREALAKREVVL